MGGTGARIMGFHPILITDWGIVLAVAFALLTLGGFALGLAMVWEMWRRGRSEESLRDFLARHSAGSWPPPPRERGYRRDDGDDGPEGHR